MAEHASNIPVDRNHKNENQQVDNDIVIIDSDSSVSDSSDADDQKVVVENSFTDVFVKSVKTTSKNLFEMKDPTFEKFESYCLKFIQEKCSEIFQKENRELELLIEREKQWRLKYIELNKEYFRFKSIIANHKKNLKMDVNAKPILLTRSIGLNVNLDRPIQLKIPLSLQSKIQSDAILKKTVNFKAKVNSRNRFNPNPSASSSGIIGAKSTLAMIRNFGVQVKPKSIGLLPSSSGAKSTSTMIRNFEPKSIELSKSSSNIKVKPTSAMETSTVLKTTSDLSITNNSVPENVNSIIPTSSKLLLPLHGTRKLQLASVSYTHQLPTSGITSTLKPVPPAIMLHHPVPPLIQNQLSYFSRKELPPTPFIIDLYRDMNYRSLVIFMIWSISLTKTLTEIKHYEIYFFMEENPSVTRNPAWKKIGEAMALRVPMGCNIGKLKPNKRYYFSLRAVDIYSRAGPFSLPTTIYLSK